MTNHRPVNLLRHMTSLKPWRRQYGVC